MTAKQPPRRGLGRGLGSLIPTAPAAEREQVSRETATGPSPVSPTARTAPPAPTGSSSQAVSRETDAVETTWTDDSGAFFAELPIAQVVPNPRQPRTVFEEEAMAELVHSIGEIGLLQPVVVRPTGDETYELVMGERRWRASQAAGLERIPAIVRETGDDDMLRDALLENLHRSQLNPLEEAAAYGQLLEDFGCTHDELAQRIGRSRPQISNTLRLLRLSPAVQRRVAAGVLSAGHARSLLAVDDPALQDRLASRVVAEGISVRALEEIVAVGEQGSGTRRPRRRAEPDPGLADVAERLGDRLETRVKVDMGRSHGRVTIDFASVEDLRRIADVIDPRNRTDRPI
ncbi:ParB/RepB/Spo0J family partition protein [Nocardioides sp. CFH 31398]|uniref:ParB/RepB/Spo0J family partition protein n=1 Tax=Nocardioides sp. CFH 31398 TaxID=2919579 RepID=UPI001F0691DC|nr:ParB/RepB/Spo0J family partition protein [Nocardioides sp. CFH 31398]MCH1865701.1 ParB/RepB/Spo0J family partition protein [Nocardioides sp. CFH 31398]